MENDFPAEEKLPTVRRNKKRHDSAQTLKVVRNKRRNCVHTDLIFKCRKLTQHECVCGHHNIEWGQLQYIKKLKDLKHVNFKAKTVYRYYKSQTIAVCKGISILIIQLKEQSEPLGTKQLTTL